MHGKCSESLEMDFLPPVCYKMKSCLLYTTCKEAGGQKNWGGGVGSQDVLLTSFLTCQPQAACVLSSLFVFRA